MSVDRLSARMARLAREVQSGDDLGQAAHRVCAAAVELIGGQAQAGITVVRRGQEVQNIGATADVVRRGDELQAKLGEGPCLDAAWEEEQVLAGDLASEHRWPQWGPVMVRDFGLTSMLCTRLFTDEKKLGALNVYSTQPHAFDEESQDLARLLAVHAATVIAAAQQVEGLRFANDRRTTIGKALGIIMVQYDVDDETAFAVLRRLSSHGNRKLFDVAQEVVAGRGLSTD